MKAVKKVQHALQADKAGHLGTLDPLGTGVLVVALGKATKLFEKHLTVNKTYKAIFKFGIETDTFDSDGKITNEQECDIDLDSVKNACKTLVGKQAQLPPRYSAKKINGKKAYELARNDQEFVLKPKEIEIFKFDCLEQVEKNTFLFEIDCSAGTYIRSCCRDLAEKLGTVGTMVAIIRTKSGEYTIDQSVTYENLSLDNVLKVEI